MSSESKAMKEIREIREKNYEVTKNMSSKEYMDYIKGKAIKARQRMEELNRAKV